MSTSGRLQFQDNMMSLKTSYMMGMLIFMALLLQPCLSFGKYYKFYPGEPQPKEKAAFLFVEFGCYIIRVYDIPLKKMPGMDGEFLPGTHQFCVGYDSANDGCYQESALYRNSGGKYYDTQYIDMRCDRFGPNFEVNFLPGHIYMLAPSWDTMTEDNLKPTVYDITDSEARQKLSQKMGWRSRFLEDKVGKVEKYFEKGPRNEPQWDREKILGQQEQGKLQSEEKNLRSQTPEKIQLNDNDVKAMLLRRNYYESFWNKSGSGIRHQYEVKNSGNNQVIVDHATGLMWPRSPSADLLKFEMTKLWLLDFNNNKYAGYSDWRLPTLEEAASLLENSKKNGHLYIDPVFLISHNKWLSICPVWTSNVYPDKYVKNNLWYVSFDEGKVDRVSYEYGCYALPVRSEK